MMGEELWCVVQAGIKSIGYCFHFVVGKRGDYWSEKNRVESSQSRRCSPSLLLCCCVDFLLFDDMFREPKPMHG